MRDCPHISSDGCKLAHTSGRSGWPKILQLLSPSSWIQRVLAGLPNGIPGIGEEIDGAMQHAPQALRHVVVMVNAKGRFANAVKKLSK